MVAHTKVRLPEGSFIRALPFAVDLEQRLRLDALVFSADTIAAAYPQLASVALRAAQRQVTDGGAEAHATAAMFQHVWSIVDQLHNVRMLLESLKLKVGDAPGFVDDFRISRDLRNRMDHLNQMIPNIAKSKESGDSLFGSLSYAVTASPKVDGPQQVYFVMQQTGPVRPKQAVGGFRVPSELRLPVGNFQLRAIGEELDIDDAILRLGPLMLAINDHIESDITRQIRHKAAELKRPESDLMVHNGANISLMLAIDPGSTQDPEQQSSA